MKILVLGAGRMGYGAAFDLAQNSPEVESITIADFHLAKAEAVVEHIKAGNITAQQIDAASYDKVLKLMSGHAAAISCVNYWHNLDLSRAAIESGTNFCDLGGNNYVVDKQLALDEQAKEAGINIIPDCGLAPGMVSILAIHGADRFDEIQKIDIRVGGLPQHPKPPLNYQLVFSVEGLINEYIEPARVIRDGEIKNIESMTELESLSFDGFPELEAFQTSGGTSTLPETFAGKLIELNYKTIRYAGHCAKFKTMIDLGLCSSEELNIGDSQIAPRKLFGTLLERYLPADEPDYVLVRLEFTGTENNIKKRLRYDIVDKFDEQTQMSAMMRTTAFPASVIAQMMARGSVKERGATPQENVIDAGSFIAELARRNICIEETWDDFNA